MFFKQFGLLFANMEWFVLVCFLVGVACLLVEVFQPGFGFFGISGLVLLVLSIVLRAVFSKEEDIVLVQVCQFVIIDVLIIGLSLLFIFIAQKKGWLKKTQLYHTGTAVDENFSDATMNYSFLLGKEGVSITVLRPSGKIQIDGNIYDAESTGFLIESGEKIIVAKIDGGIIKVEKSKINNNIGEF